MNSVTVHKFILDELKLQPDEVEALQINYHKKLVYIELSSFEKASEIVSEYNLKCKINFENVDFVVKLFMVDGGTDVKLHDLPPRMNESVILKKMCEYGEILNFTEEKWGDEFAFKNISNGIRIVRMKLEKNIPSYITIAGEQTFVTYKNQILTCKWCENRLHYGLTCAENRLTKGQTVNNRITSFADALKQNNNNVSNDEPMDSHREEVGDTSSNSNNSAATNSKTQTTSPANNNTTNNNATSNNTANQNDNTTEKRSTTGPNTAPNFAAPNMGGKFWKNNNDDGNDYDDNADDDDDDETMEMDQPETSRKTRSSTKAESQLKKYKKDSRASSKSKF